MRHLLLACRWLLLLVWLALPLGALAQSTAGYGDWQLHLPNNRAKSLADAGSRVYVATENAFFYYDKELNTTRLLSRRDGLHDVGVSAVAYDSVTQQTLVAYANTNLDIFQPDGTIRNATDILRKQLSGEKVINSLYVSNKLIYLSCSFGLLAFDMAKLEVRDTYSNIGPGGQVLTVYAATTADGYLYAATSGGVLRALLTDNLLDYRSWTVTLPARPGDPYRTLATHGGTVYLGVNNDGVYRFIPASQSWQQVVNLGAVAYQQLTPSLAGLLITDNQKITVLASTGATRTIQPALVQQPIATLRARDGSFFVADNQNGLLKISADGQQAESFVTNAPATALAFSVLADASSNTVDVFAGGYQENYAQNDNYSAGFYDYKDGQWTSITGSTLSAQQYPNPKDLTRGTRTPDGTLYVGSYGNGLLEWKGPGQFRLFNPQNGNAPLLSAITNPNYTRVTDVTADANGDVWVVNRHQLANRSGLFVFSPTAGTWRTISYFSGSENLDRLAFDEYEVAWLTTARRPVTGGGVFAFDPSTQQVRLFTTSNGLPSNVVYDVVKDRRGAIWVTCANSLDGGVAVFSDPSQAFDTSVGFAPPILRRGGTSDVNFPILRSQTVLCVAVDGADRKWFGTADNGLWLFNEDADEALLHFTTDNSPLPSNHINDVAVNDRTGEVFVATDKGVVAYRGSATVTEEKPSCAKVSPNPVRTNFTGQVGISGLANNAIVKITDVTGTLVYQTRAAGGTLVWNLTDYNGRRVNSGVYLVLSSDADGKNGCISKIAVVGN